MPASVLVSLPKLILKSLPGCVATVFFQDAVLKNRGWANPPGSPRAWAREESGPRWEVERSAFLGSVFGHVRALYLPSPSQMCLRGLCRFGFCSRFFPGVLLECRGPEMVMQQLGLLRWLALLMGLMAVRANSHSGSPREGEVIGT